ncbi:MAG: ABC transporter ATP-binding protein [Thermoflavifilum sp.]|nr:ABC transporter ATP-binding protein [Thermoflavifilum sp.]MCL6514671.1 ABC transporter ATP-binding protein [Alicyclobacillus sp.]
MSEHAVVLEAVSKRLKGREVLRNVTLEIPRGQIIGIVGPNGSGKSMLFRIISGLVRPTQGKVFVLGKRLHEDIAFPPSLGILLEHPGFLPTYSGFLNLRFLADIRRRIGPEEIAEAIRRVGLDPSDRRPVKAYSLGMKQKLAIAQALMERPELLLLDEPMNGLDEESVAAMYEVLRAERGRGATILLTSHHREDIDALCDEVYAVRDGNVMPLDR